MLQMPRPRGELSAAVAAMLTGGRRVPAGRARQLVAAVADPLHDGDLQLALACCYELHYRGFADVADRWEWDPGLLAVRAELEEAFEEALRREVAEPRDGGGPVWTELRTVVDTAGGPALSKHLARHASLAQVREFLVQRSVYHLREADSHTWGIPRLAGRPKAALVEIQADEYGGGSAARMHSALFAQTLRAAGLADTYGCYWDAASAETFASVNAMSLFGLHRRHRGALAGHLAALEMSSTQPNRDYGRGLRRLGLPQEAIDFFDEHVEADAVHEQVAAVDLCGSLVAAEPTLRSAVLWGAACCVALDASAAEELVGRWAPVSTGVVA